MLVNLLIILIIILVLGILLSGNGAKRPRRQTTSQPPKKIPNKQVQNPETAQVEETQEITENKIQKEQPAEKIEKVRLTDQEKQTEMKKLGAAAFDKGQEARFSTLRILDFGDSLFNLSNTAEKFEDLTEDERNLLSANVDDFISSSGAKDLVCFKSG